MANTKKIKDRKKIAIIQKGKVKNNNIKTKISKRKRIKEKIVLRKEKRDTRKKPTITFEEEINEKDCPQNHKNLNISFKSEEDAEY